MHQVDGVGLHVADVHDVVQALLGAVDAEEAHGGDGVHEVPLVLVGGVGGGAAALLLGGRRGGIVGVEGSLDLLAELEKKNNKN